MNKKKFLFITLILIAFTAMLSFSVNHFYSTNPEVINEREDTVKNNPKIDIKVEKEYDENGNIIRYDSSYTYIYTHPNGNSEELNMDSIFESFRPYFFDRGFDIMHDPFNRFFDKDTFYQRHFFDDDFFMQQFENEMFRFEEMMQKMDSLRNRFLREQYPDYEQLDEPVKKKKTKGVET